MIWVACSKGWIVKLWVFSAESVCSVFTALQWWREGKAGRLQPPRRKHRNHRRAFGFMSKEIWPNNKRKQHLLAILTPLSVAAAPLSDGFLSHSKGPCIRDKACLFSSHFTVCSFLLVLFPALIWIFCSLKPLEIRDSECSIQTVWWYM